MLPKLFFVLLSIFCLFLGSQGTTCPETVEKIIKRLGDCDSVTCVSGLTQEKCPAGTVLEEGAALCGCCPGCVKYQLKYRDDCDKDDGKDGYDYDPACTDLICPILKFCPRGTVCSDYFGMLNYKCNVPRPLPNGPTTATCQNKCFLKKSIIENENEIYGQNRNVPTCTEDGFFAPVQCKGNKNEGDCFCVDECGERIFGRQLYDRAENMTCGCSRLVNSLRKTNLIMSMHCKENGDFEPLQCDTDSGLCYCVDEMTGKTTGEVMPENKFQLLPCFNASDENFANGGNYLRRCESEWVAAMEVTLEGATHGMTYTHTALDCDYDGGYAPAFWDMDNSQDRCVHRSGTTLGNYFRMHAIAPVMDCKCARDTVYNARLGIPYRSLACQQENKLVAPGSYPTYTSNQQSAYCLDSDGYQYGPSVDPNLICCLESSAPCTDTTICLPDATRNYRIFFCDQYIYGRD